MLFVFPQIRPMLRVIRTCSRSSRAAVSCGRLVRVNRSLLEVNEDFEYRPAANGGGAVDIEQVLSKTNCP